MSRIFYEFTSQQNTFYLFSANFIYKCLDKKFYAHRNFSVVYIMHYFHLFLSFTQRCKNINIVSNRNTVMILKSRFANDGDIIIIGDSHKNKK